MTIPVPVEGLTFSFTNVAISGSAGTGDFAIAGSVSINILGLRTRAWIADNVQINQTGALPGSSAEVTATDVSTVKSVAGALAVTSGSAGIGAAIVVDVIDKDTRAYIGSGVTLRVAGDVNVASTAGMTYFALAASAGGSTSAAVSGSIIVAVIDQGSDDGTRAFIDDPTAVESGGALSVTASAPNSYELYAGQIAVASSAGVGLSLVIFVNTGIVDAFIGAFDTITAGAGGVTVSAFQSEDIKLIAVGGSVGGSAGIAGSATIDVLSLTTTRAHRPPRAPSPPAGRSRCRRPTTRRSSASPARSRSAAPRASASVPTSRCRTSTPRRGSATPCTRRPAATSPSTRPRASTCSRSPRARASAAARASRSTPASP